MTTDRILFVEDFDDKKKAAYSCGQDYSEAKQAGAIGYGLTVEDWKANRLVPRFIYGPSEYDASFYGPQVFRWDSANIRGVMCPVVKIKLKTEMMYFAEDTDSEDTTFESRGSKLQYLIVFDKEKFLEIQGLYRK